jgi:HSP20 family molecular chaperone IbpA
VLDAADFRSKKGAIAMKKHSTRQAEKADAVRIVPAQTLNGRMDQIRGMIAKRAYELYERRGMANGGALGDWAQAERELVHPCRHDLSESEEAIILRAEIPSSYKADQLQISIEPGRMMVSGEREIEVSYWDGQETRTEPQPQRIFRSHDLPVEIDPSSATAFLKSDVLIVMIPKVHPPATTMHTARSAG